MAAKKAFTFDEKSHFLVEHFSVILNHMLPVEYIYNNWHQCIDEGEANRCDPNFAGGRSTAVIETGSRAEGFCIPRCLMASPNLDIFHINAKEMEHWEPNIDLMTENDCFVRCENYKTCDVGGVNMKDKGDGGDKDKDKDKDQSKGRDKLDTNYDKVVSKNVEKHKTTVDTIPIFSVSPIEQDPRYVKLLLTPEWKSNCPKYCNREFLRHSFLFPTENTLFVSEMNENENPRGQWTQEVWAPVNKMESKGEIPKYERDETQVFKYPQTWPEVAKDFLIRPRSGPWPSAETIKDIVSSGCHIVPVGRGKRHCPDEAKDLSDTASFSLPTKDQDLDNHHAGNNNLFMDDAEWRISFSVAENKLGQSVTPVQRHVIVLLKMLKKCYFPGVVSSYHLKNLLFWEIERKDESFWDENQTAKCLVFMLDRIEDCLQDGLLPHYIIPQSNLLEGEDRDALIKAAEETREVRINIVEKTFTMFTRFLTMGFQSMAFQRDLNLETLIVKLQDKAYLEDVQFSEESVKNRDIDKEKKKKKDKDKNDKKRSMGKHMESQKQQLLFSLYRLFIAQYQQCLDELNVICCDATIEREVDTSINLYQSLLARTLIKLWLAIASHSNEAFYNRDILTFIKQEMPEDYINVEFLKISMNYVAHAQEGYDLSLVVPHVLEKSRKIHRDIAQENFDEFRNPVLRLQSVFRSGYTQEFIKIMHELGITDVDPNQVEYVPPKTK